MARRQQNENFQHFFGHARQEERRYTEIKYMYMNDNAAKHTQVNTSLHYIGQYKYVLHRSIQVCST
jgi:hypothetical protein